MPRPWSESTRCAFVASATSRTRRPDSRSIQSMISRKPSVSKIESASCRSIAPRSRPMPVSMFCFGSGVSVPSGVQVELHEDEVPELEEALAALAAGRAVGLAAAVLLAPVVVELGARPARAGLPAGPQKFSERGSPTMRSRGMPIRCQPRDRRLVLVEAEPGIAREDGRPDPVRVEPHVLGDELPGEVDRAVLEVVAEREVAEHLEHRGVPRRQADLVEVGVLAARAQHLLHGREARRRRLLRAREVRLERLHAGRDEERRRVLGRRDQRPRGEAAVAPLLEERQEALPQLRGRPHGSIVGAGPTRLGRAMPRRARRARGRRRRSGRDPTRRGSGSLPAAAPRGRRRHGRLVQRPGLGRLGGEQEQNRHGRVREHRPARARARPDQTLHRGRAGLCRDDRLDNAVRPLAHTGLDGLEQGGRQRRRTAPSSSRRSASRLGIGAMRSRTSAIRSFSVASAFAPGASA